MRSGCPLRIKYELLSINNNAKGKYGRLPFWQCMPGRKRNLPPKPAFDEMIILL